jgi:hypothetical protein
MGKRIWTVEKDMPAENKANAEEQMWKKKSKMWENKGIEIVCSQDVRLEINRKLKCGLHSCIENLGNFRAFK